MNPFSYLAFMTSVVLALSITRILTGVGRLLQLRREIRIYWVHLVWSLNLFIFATLIWWIQYRWQTQAQWTFFLFLFVLTSPALAFLESVLLFPDSIDKGTDMHEHYFANHRWFFVLGALLSLLDGVDTYLKGWDHFVAQGPLYIVTLSLIFVLSMIAAVTRNGKYHAFYSVFFLVYLLAYITINLRLIA